MALPVLKGSNFEITAISFNPSVVVYGESTTMSVTVKNVSGSKVTKVCVWGYATIPTVDYKSFPTSSITNHTIDGPMYYFAGTDWSDSSTFKTVSWANNATMTFSGFVVINNTNASKEDKISLPEYHWGANKSPSTSKSEPTDIGIRFCVYQANDENGECSNVNLQGSTDELLHIISSRDNPRLSFNADRCTNGVLNDEGVNLLTDIKLDSDKPNSQILEHGYSASLSCSPEASGSALNATISQMVSGITDSPTAIAGTYSNGSDYLLTLTVTNGYETAVSKFSIARAFANVHMSGCSTGGVAFGRFSSSTDGSPKFECEYPAYFYGGIACGINMQSGFVAAANISSGSLRTITVKFDTAFTTAPVVMLTLSSGSTAGSNGRVGCGIVPGSITTSGFQCKIWNGDSSARSPGLYWLAVST